MDFTAAALFAEGEATGWASLAALGGNLIQVGFSALVGWYLLTKAIPKMQDQFLADQKAAREKHESSQSETRDKHDASQKLQRDDYKASLKEQRGDFRTWMEALEVAANRREDRAGAEGRQALEMVLKHCQIENERRDEHAEARDEALRKELAFTNETLRALATLIEERIK